MPAPFLRAFCYCATCSELLTGRNFTTVRRSPDNCRLEQPIALLDNDGVMVCGTSVLDAFDRLEVLESTAETLINGRLLGSPKSMPDSVIADLANAFLKK